MFLLSLFSDHSFLRWLIFLSCSWSSYNFRFEIGSSIFKYFCTGSICWILIFKLFISLMITSSVTVTCAGGSCSNGTYPNSCPSCSAGCLMSSSISISLVFCSLNENKVYFCDSSSTAQLFTLALRVFFSKNLFNGRWSLWTVIHAESR